MTDKEDRAREVEALQTALMQNELARRAIQKRCQTLRASFNPNYKLPNWDALLNVRREIIHVAYGWRKEYNSLSDLYDTESYARATAELARATAEVGKRAAEARKRHIVNPRARVGGPNAVTVNPFQ